MACAIAGKPAARRYFSRWQRFLYGMRRMELDEFVRKTLEQVIDGVGQACKHARANKAHIGSSSYSPIEFDVAVTVTEGSESKADGGIKVAGIGIGGHGKTELTNSSVSRVKFTVLVSLPTTVEY
jgi:hypothetical protein